ncbi:MAG: AEC family transporter [Cardiobacteriaceae bacterium]|nr:AEC family transporter [Cardiobacteriaceae bacterium]
MNALWAGLQFSATVIVPILALMAMGFLMRKQGQLDDKLVSAMNMMVYRYALPSLLFVSVMKSDVAIRSQWKILLAGYLAVFILYFIGNHWGKKWFEPYDRGVFTQVLFRGNLAILGIALADGVYDNEAFAVAAIFAGMVALQLNILAVICLTHDPQAKRFGWAMVMKVLQNPLVVALLLAIVCKMLSLKLPQMVLNFTQYVSNLTLPLALLCAGATFDLRGIFSSGRVALIGSALRLLLAPPLFIGLGWLLGLEGYHLGILCLMGCTPTASAGYIMAKAMPNNNAVAAANMIALTTLGSLFLVGSFIAAFDILGWR